MLILQLQENPLYVVSVIFAVIISISLHELAHGFAAIQQGDRTPIETGHMTLNPLVHMPPISLILLITVGIAFGAMPINHARFRHRFGEAFVAAAGPVMNLALAGLAITALGIWVNLGPADPSLPVQNARNVLWWFGLINIVLFIFNLIPMPPLDGSHIFANFSPRYRNFIYHQMNPQVAIFIFLAVLVGLSYTGFGLFDVAADAANLYLTLFIRGS